jgi:hypothetical protein
VLPAVLPAVLPVLLPRCGWPLILPLNRSYETLRRDNGFSISGIRFETTSIENGFSVRGIRFETLSRENGFNAGGIGCWLSPFSKLVARPGLE